MDEYIKDFEQDNRVTVTGYWHEERCHDDWPVGFNPLSDTTTYQNLDYTRHTFFVTGFAIPLDGATLRGEITPQVLLQVAQDDYGDELEDQYVLRDDDVMKAIFTKAGTFNAELMQ